MAIPNFLQQFATQSGAGNQYIAGGQISHERTMNRSKAKSDRIRASAAMTSARAQLKKIKQDKELAKMQQVENEKNRQLDREKLEFGKEKLVREEAEGAKDRAVEVAKIESLDAYRRSQIDNWNVTSREAERHNRATETFGAINALANYKQAEAAALRAQKELGNQGNRMFQDVKGEDVIATLGQVLDKDPDQLSSGLTTPVISETNRFMALVRNRDLPKAAERHPEFAYVRDSQGRLTQQFNPDFVDLFEGKYVGTHDVVNRFVTYYAAKLDRDGMLYDQKNWWPGTLISLYSQDELREGKMMEEEVKKAIREKLRMADEPMNVLESMRNAPQDTFGGS